MARHLFIRGIVIAWLAFAIAPDSALCDPAAPASGPVQKIAPEVYRRTVFLGDSITDGNTYPQLVRQALADAKLPPMVAICAGIGGDTAHGMAGRLDRDVLVWHPTLVTFNAGANDSLHGVSADDYERDVRAIAERLTKEHVPLMLLTPNVMGPRLLPQSHTLLTEYEKRLRRVAADYGLRVADVNRRQNDAESAGHHQLAPDDLHPNWEGQKSIARAVLDAMGYADLRVPDRIAGEPLPGVISDWRIKPLEKGASLSDDSIAQIKPDDTWLALRLPEREPIPDLDANSRWLDDMRALGASVSLRQKKADAFVGIATIDSDSAKAVQLHTGGELQQVWLNGKSVYENQWHHGYHIGRQSVSVGLAKGANTLIIKTGPVFFLSMTDGPMWPEK